MVLTWGKSSRQARPCNNSKTPLYCGCILPVTSVMCPQSEPRLCVWYPLVISQCGKYCRSPCLPLHQDHVRSVFQVAVLYLSIVTAVVWDRVEEVVGLGNSGFQSRGQSEPPTMILFLPSPHHCGNDRHGSCLSKVRFLSLLVFFTL